MIIPHRPNKNSLAQLTTSAAAAPFASTLLPVDEPLWGSFWQFDVIAPGSRLPPLELALLRAGRLEQHWVEDTSPHQFLADLHAAISHPQAGVWRVWLAGSDLLIFAAPAPALPLMTVVWYQPDGNCLHAGYRTAAAAAHLAGAVAQRPPRFLLDAAPTHPDWLREYPPDSTDTSLDAAILRWRQRG